jgi:hypothetical protein
MADPQAKDSLTIYEIIQKARQDRDRRAQARSHGVLGKIEDTTNEVLRKHEEPSS